MDAIMQGTVSLQPIHKEECRMDQRTNCECLFNLTYELRDHDN